MNKLDKNIIQEYFEIKEYDAYKALWHLFDYMTDLNEEERHKHFVIDKLVMAGVNLGHCLKYSTVFNKRIAQLYAGIIKELDKQLNKITEEQI